MIALTRLERKGGKGAEASIIRALAEDLGIVDFDPLDCKMGDAWQAAKPYELRGYEGVWRTNGDTVERLEMFAQSILKGEINTKPKWRRTNDVIGWFIEW